MKALSAVASLLILAACAPGAQPVAQISPACEPYQRGCLEPYRPYQAPEPIPAALAETSQPGLRRIGPGVAVVCE
jgi:hypothetical protein